jgi:hypothetical protein
MASTAAIPSDGVHYPDMAVEKAFTRVSGTVG